MDQEPLTKEEFHHWKDNHFDHLCLKIESLAKDIGWLKWLIMGIAAAIMIGFLRMFFSF